MAIHTTLQPGDLFTLTPTLSPRERGRPIHPHPNPLPQGEGAIYSELTTHSLLAQLDALPAPAYDRPGSWIDGVRRELQIINELKRRGVRV